MYQRLMIFLLFFIVSNVSFAQPRRAWIHFYGSDGRDGFSDIYATANGDYIMCGVIDEDGDEESWTHPDLWIVRVNHAGNVIWENSYRLFDGNVWSSGTTIIETDNGDFVIGGYTHVNNSQRRFITVKVSENGDIIWQNQYGGDLSGWCFAVIETKAGGYLLGGRLTPEDGTADCYAVMVAENGDIIWEETYGEADELDRITGIRETENDGFLLGGILDRTYALIKIDDEGDVVWEQTYQRGTGSYCTSLDSSPNGFALGGYSIYRNQQGANISQFRFVLVDSEGRSQLDQVYLDNEFDQARCLTSMSDGGFIIVGERNGGDGLAVRTEPGGNLSWSTDEFPGPIKSVVEDRDRNALMCGFSGFYRQGMLVKYYPERSAPTIIMFTPNRLEYKVLQDDIVFFSVAVEDVQDDTLSYFWTHNDEEIEPDTVANDTSATTIVFNELGIDTVKCVVSDGELADSIQWIIHVTELYIDSHTPDSIDLSIRRNTTVDFSVTTRAIDGDPVQYEWVHDGEVLDEFDDSLSIHFDLGRDHEVEVVAYRGEQNDNVIWQITMLDLIVNYIPRELDIAVPIDTVMEFSIEPFNPEDPSLNIVWTLDGDSIDNRSWTFINFDSAGEHQVAVHISDSSSADSMRWNIMVSPNEVSQNELTLLPKVPTLYPPSPNPFNSQTSVRYALPVAGKVRLELFDVSGRLVAELISEHQNSGWYDVSINCDQLVSGVYFVRMMSNQQVQTQKVLLLR